jgi:hypothetical protein
MTLQPGSAADLAAFPRLDRVVVRGVDHLETELDGQTLMLSIQQGSYFAVSDTAQRVWQLIAKPASVRSVAARLLEEYDVSPEQCATEVSELVDALVARGLARVVAP